MKKNYLHDHIFFNVILYNVEDNLELFFNDILASLFCCLKQEESISSILLTSFFSWKEMSFFCFVLASLQLTWQNWLFLKAPLALFFCSILWNEKGTVVEKQKFIFSSTMKSFPFKLSAQSCKKFRKNCLTCKKTICIF